MKNIIIGFLSGLSLFLILGATENPRIIDTPPEELIRQLVGIEDKNLIGKYQGFTYKGVYMMNTETGEVYELEPKDKVWIKISPENNWIINPGK